MLCFHILPRFRIFQDFLQKSIFSDYLNSDTIPEKYIIVCIYKTPLNTLISSNPARKIATRKGLTDQETFERETASFEVELSHTDVEGIWQKDGIRVKPNNQWRVSTNGRVHGLTLSNLTLEDTGTIVFSAEGVRTTARLTVKGKYWPAELFGCSVA